jgi:pyridoxal biosynthesis lyase PdxS
MDMVEKVARAFEPVRWGNFDRYCEAKEYTPAERAERLANSEFLQVSLRGARAAIEAMRDNPDGADAIRILTHSGTWETAEELWQAGIAAALTPSPASK